MRYTIIKPDGMMGVDGRWCQVSMEGLPDDLHAVQFDTDQGHEEWTGDKDNTFFDRAEKYQSMITRWQAKADAEDNPPPPSIGQLRSAAIRKVNDNTPAVIANFTYNSQPYNLTRDVIDQLREMHSLLTASVDPDLYLPIEITLGETDGIEDTATINTLATFKNVIVAVMEWIKDKRAEARAIKTAINAATYEELELWVDPRL